MAAPLPPARGDQAVVSVLVKVEPSKAFRVFTEEVDAWWRGGMQYRIGKHRSVVHFEPKLGGRMFESFEDGSGARIVETGRVTAWDPPARLVFEWRAVNFAPSEKTEVEVTFEPTPSGTLVTVRHRGWSRIRDDHPVRHGQDAITFLRTMGGWWANLMSSMREHVE